MRNLLLIVALFLVTPFAWSLNSSLIPEKGNADPASYRQIKLENGLKVLLISDKRVLQSIAALSVGVGYYEDPNSVAGAAHLLEHVVSKGSKRFPGVAEYKQFLSDNGGASNASTSAMNTNYYFYVNSDAFKGALERFVGQFDSPLLNPKMILHEANAVESEFRLKYTDNYRKYREVLRLAFNPEHPYRKFSTGNKKTLLENGPTETIRAVKDIFNQYYFAENMGLVLFGPQNLEELERLAYSNFSKIRQGKIEDIERRSISPFTDKGLNKLIKMKPLTNKRRLAINYLVPGQNIEGFQGMGHFISWLLDGKQDGGLENYLQQQELIYDLKPTLTEIDKQHDLLSIEFRMTADGLKSADHILSATYDFLAHATKPINFQSAYQQYREIQLIKAARLEKPWSSKGIRNLSKKLLHTRGKNSIELLDIPLTFKVESAAQYLKHLAADKLIMVTQNNRYQLAGKSKRTGRFEKRTQPGKIETIYNTPYHIVDLAWRYQATKDFEFQLPKSPPFLLARDGNLQESTVEKLSPKVEYKFDFYNVNNTKVHAASQFENNSQFKSLELYWDNELLVKTPSLKNKLINLLFAKRISFYLANIKNEAEDSLISMSVDASDKGIAIRFSGYQSSFQKLLSSVLKALESFELSDKELRTTYRGLLIQLKPRLTDRLQSKFINRLKAHYNKPAVSRDSYALLKELDESAFENYHAQFFKRSKLTIITSGEVDKRKIGEIISRSQTMGEIEKNFVFETGHLKSFFDQRVEDKDNGFMRLSFSDLEPVESEVFTQFLAKQIKAPMFHELRTVQQLGYKVSATSRLIDGHSLLELYVQSPSANPEQIEKSISVFNVGFLEDIKSIGDEDFQRRKTVFLNAWLTRNSMNEYLVRKSIWAFRNNLSESWREQAIDFIKALDKETFLKLASHYLKPDSSSEIKLITAPR